MLTDSTGKKSATLTAFVIGFLIVNIRLLFSGVSIGKFTIGQFTGSEYALAVGALSAMYVMRRHNSMKEGGKSGDI